MSDWNVVCKLKVMPEDVDVDFDKIREGVKALAGERCDVHSMDEKPIAFGLKALEVTLLLNDKVGGMDEVQESIGKIEGVGEVEVVDLNRL
jgi:elongation factor 1-beta